MRSVLNNIQKYWKARGKLLYAGKGTQRMCYDMRGGSEENHGDLLADRCYWIRLNATTDIRVY